MLKSCKRCGKPFNAIRMASFCSARCRDSVDEVRFWGKVDKSAGPDACWPWRGAVDPKGYGWFSIGRTMRHAHRVALELSLGRRLKRLEYSLHHCDNPPCCNVHEKHVHKGTCKMNFDEMRARGRERRAHGAAHCKTKLTWEQVQEIRASREAWAAANPGRKRMIKGDPLSVAALGRKYGVSGASIRAVLVYQTHRLP